MISRFRYQILSLLLAFLAVPALLAKDSTSIPIFPLWEQRSQQNDIFISQDLKRHREELFQSLSRKEKREIEEHWFKSFKGKNWSRRKDRQPLFFPYPIKNVPEDQIFDVRSQFYRHDMTKECRQKIKQLSPVFQEYTINMTHAGVAPISSVEDLHQLRKSNSEMYLHIKNSLSEIYLSDINCYQTLALHYLLNSFLNLGDIANRLYSTHLASFLYNKGHLEFLTPGIRCHAGGEWSAIVQEPDSLTSQRPPDLFDTKYLFNGAYSCKTSTISLDPFQAPADLAATFAHEVTHLLNDKFGIHIPRMSDQPRDLVEQFLTMDEYLASTRMAHHQIMNLSAYLSHSADKLNLGNLKEFGSIVRYIPSNDLSKFSSDLSKTNSWATYWALLSLTPQRRWLDDDKISVDTNALPQNYLLGPAEALYSALFLSPAPVHDFTQSYSSQWGSRFRELQDTLAHGELSEHERQMIREVDQEVITNRQHIFRYITKVYQFNQDISYQAPLSTPTSILWTHLRLPGLQAYTYEYGRPTPSQVWMQYAYKTLGDKLKEVSPTCQRNTDNAHLITASNDRVVRRQEQIARGQAFCSNYESLFPDNEGHKICPEKDRGVKCPEQMPFGDDDFVNERGSGRPERGSGRPEVILAPCVRDLKP